MQSPKVTGVTAKVAFLTTEVQLHTVGAVLCNAVKLPITVAGNMAPTNQQDKLKLVLFLPERLPQAVGMD